MKERNMWKYASLNVPYSYKTFTKIISFYKKYI